MGVLSLGRCIVVAAKGQRQTKQRSDSSSKRRARPAGVERRDVPPQLLRWGKLVTAAEGGRH